MDQAAAKDADESVRATPPADVQNRLTSRTTHSMITAMVLTRHRVAMLSAFAAGSIIAAGSPLNVLAQPEARSSMAKLTPTKAAKTESSTHRLHRAAMGAHDFGKSHLARTYGGMSFSHAGSVLDIYLTELDPKAENAILAAIPSVPRSSISFVKSDWSAKQLDTVQQAITTDSDLLTRTEGIPLASWGADYAASRNVIYVVRPTPRQIAYLKHRYGPTVRVDSAAGFAVSAADRVSDFAPWNVGDFISDAGTDCTSGPGMHNTSGQSFMVTAAHCFTKGSTIYNGAVTIEIQVNGYNPIGSVYAQDLRYKGNDAELIPTNASDDMWVGGTATTAEVDLDPAYRWVPSGTPLCVNGAFEGVHCTGVTGIETCVLIDPGATQRLACNEVNVTSFDPQLAGKGDSGGPVYVKDSNGAYYILGIWSAIYNTHNCSNWIVQDYGRQCSSSGYYADITPIASEWGLNMNN